MQVILNGVGRGYLTPDMARLYVDEVKALGASIVVWTNTVLSIQKGGV